MAITRDALLAAICERPDNDTPRLILADWLEEHGDEADRDRAAFIRLQIELAHAGSDHRRIRELRQREKVLLQRYAPAWRVPFGDEHKPVFERGFVANACLSPGELLESGRRFFEAAPLQYVHLTSSEGADGSAGFAELA